MGAPLTVPRHQLSISDYYKMVEVGILREDSRVELIEGELIEMAPIGGKHLWSVNALVAIFARQVGNKAIVSPQNPVVFPDKNAPQPDIALLRPDYAGELPTASDVLLVIEIADTTLIYDRDTKIPLYARHGIPEAWLFDIQRQSLSIYLHPAAGGYQRLLSPGPSDTVSPSLLPNVEVKLSEIWR
jgi:Uma2 family endonuclease